MAYIGQTPNNTWQAVVRTKNVNKSATFLLKSDAEKWARSTEVEIDRGIYQNKDEAATTTLGMACDRFEEEVIPNLKLGKLTCRGYAISKQKLAICYWPISPHKL